MSEWRCDTCGQTFEEGPCPGPPKEARDVISDKIKCLNELSAAHDEWTGKGPIRSSQIKSLLGYLVEKGVVTPDE